MKKSIYLNLTGLILAIWVFLPSSSGPQNIQPPAASGQTATQLPDGRWLVVGGEESGAPLATASIWEPATGITTQLANSLNEARSDHTATMLPDGTVFIFGGIGPDGQVVSSPELFDPVTQSFELLPTASSLSPSARSRHTATLLTDARLLIAGGIGTNGQVLDFAELLDISQSAIRNPQSAIRISQSVARHSHTASLLPDGTVLLSGGQDGNGDSIADHDLFDPSTSSFIPQSAIRIPQSDDPDPLPFALSPLRLEASLPPDGSADIPLDAVIALRFSKPLRVETANNDTVTLSGPAGVEQIKGVPAEGGMLAFITPVEPLLSGATYTLTLNGPIDQDGFLLPLSGFSFTTEGTSSDSEPAETAEQASAVSVQSPAPSQTSESEAETDPTPSSSNPSRGENAGRRRSLSAELRWQGEYRVNPHTQRRMAHSSWEDLPPLRAGPGVAALAGQVLQIDGEPLRNVTIRVGDKRTRTNGTGRFLIRDLTPGFNEMIVDGLSASSTEVTYGIFEIGVFLIEGETSVVPFTIWMPELDMENAVTIPSPTTSEVVVTTSKIPGLEVRIPPGTVIRDIDGNPVTTLSITLLPDDRGPMPMPQDMEFPLMFTTQPGASRVESVDGSVSPGISIVYPNVLGLTPGSKAEFYRPDAAIGWIAYGEGTISEDGAQVIPDPGATVHQLSCANLGNGPAAPNQEEECKNDPEKCKKGDPVALGSGLFVVEKTDFFLPDVIPIRLTRTYRQNDTVKRPFGLGTSHPYEIYLIGDRNNYSWAELILEDGSRIHYDRTSPGTGFADAIMEHTTTHTKFYQSVLSWNSSRGGWDIKLKDGTVYEFIVFFGPEIVLLQTVQDRAGNRLSVQRDSNMRITTITSPNGRWLEFTYDTSDRVIEARDNIGRTVTYTYDAEGRLSTVTDAEGGVTTYTYDDTDLTDTVRKTRMLTITDARGITFLTNEYDTTGKVIQQTQADGSVYQFAYTLDINGQVTQADVTDPRNVVGRMTFNGDGELLTDTRALGTPEEQTTTYELEPGTNLTLAVTDALNRRTEYTYDSMGNTTSITRLAGTPNAVTTTFTYEPTFNQVASITNPLGNTTSFAYDEKGNLTTVTDPLGTQVTFAYNETGQPVSITDALGNSAQFTYDFGDLASVTDPLGNSANRFIDAAGRLISMTNALNQLTRYDYDDLNRLLQVTDPQGSVTGFGYDPNGNLLSVTDARQNATATPQSTVYSYDDMDRLAIRTDPLGLPESYQYDENGNMIQFTDRKGQVTIFQYDALNRRTFAGFGAVGDPPAYESTITYIYDAGNRLTQIVDSISGTITRTYDSLDRLTSEATPQGSVSYTYDNAGRRTSMTVTGQPTVNYTYDAANRLTQITQGTSTVSFAYDLAGRRTSLTLPNGILVEYAYDAASKVTAITYKLGTTVLGDLTYTYDAAGNRTKIGGSFARTGIPQAIATSNYNAANQQLALSDKTMTYDNNGNLTSLTDTNGTTDYTWNARDQLVGISGPSVTASFEYDGLGRRQAKVINGSTTEFLYDGVNPVQATDGVNVLANILTGLGTDEFLTRTNVAAGTTDTLLTDALGSTAALADSSGAVQTEYTYEPFGGTTVSGISSTNPFQYTGRENDGTGLYYYRARYYHPQLQRFISEDPIGFRGGNFNLYGYVRNDPVNRTDPSGQRDVEDFIIGQLLGSIGKGLAGILSGIGDAITPNPAHAPRHKNEHLGPPPKPPCNPKKEDCDIDFDEDDLSGTPLGFEDL